MSEEFQTRNPGLRIKHQKTRTLSDAESRIDNNGAVNPCNGCSFCPEETGISVCREQTELRLEALPKSLFLGCMQVTEGSVEPPKMIQELARGV